MGMVDVDVTVLRLSTLDYSSLSLFLIDETGNPEKNRE
jgi:hypothetical protein